MRIKEFISGIKLCYHNRRLPTGNIIWWRNLTKTNYGQGNVIEIEINSFCNLGCAQCDRSCASEQAPSNEIMTIEQIKKFIDQSIKENRKWRRITVLGGEPTLHPNFLEIVELLRKYRDEYSNGTIIRVTSNGYGPIVNGGLKELNPDIEINNTAKTTRLQTGFCSYNVAPRDLPEYVGANYKKGCVIPEVCGIGLSRYGYYTCGAGAAVDRIFGFRLGIMDLKDATKENLIDQRVKLCSCCGRFKSSETNLSISHSWKTAYENYKKNKPSLWLF